MSGTPVPDSRRKERLSLAFVRAIAARAGYELIESEIDIDSIDGTLKCTCGKRPQIDFQAKATSQDVVRDRHVVFELSIKNYDDLRADTVVPRILIVYVLPENSDDWLSSNEDALQLRKCAYWISLRGEPESENSTSVTVNLPRAQTFDCRQLEHLMSRAERSPIL